MRSFFKFLVVGGFSTAIQYASLIYLVEIINTNVIIATSTGYLLGAIFNYIANYYYSFESESGHLQALRKFSVIVFLGAITNAIIVSMLNEVFNLSYLISQIASTSIITMANYIMLKFWAYK